MDRRGFLESITAITTALAGGVKLPTGAEVAAAPIPQPKPLRMQNDLLRLLRECEAVSIEGHATYDGPMIYVVEYIHFPGRKKSSETSLMVDGYTRGMRPIGVTKTISAGELMKIRVTWA